MAMSKNNKTATKIDPDVFTNSYPKRNSPPAPKGAGGMSKGKTISGIDPDAFTNSNPVRNSPPSPKL